MNRVIYVENSENICGNKAKDFRNGFSNYDLVNDI